MRTIVEIPEQQIEALKALSEREGLSRAELMRRALAEYLTRHQTETDNSAFGLWRDNKQDGLDYQQELRKEWDE